MTEFQRKERETDSKLEKTGGFTPSPAPFQMISATPSREPLATGTTMMVFNGQCR